VFICGSFSKRYAFSASLSYITELPLKYAVFALQRTTCYTVFWLTRSFDPYNGRAALKATLLKPLV